MKVTARIVVAFEVDVTDADTKEEANERVRNWMVDLSVILPGWADHPHSCLVEDVEITS